MWSNDQTVQNWQKGWPENNDLKIQRQSFIVTDNHTVLLMTKSAWRVSPEGERAFRVCPHWPSAAEAEVTVSSAVVSHVPLPHNGRHCLNIKTIFRKNQKGRSKKVSKDLYVCARMALCFCVFVFTFVCINLCLCVHLLCMCPTPPSFNPATVLWRLADVQRGRGGCSG